MRTVSFIVPGVPVAQPRQRHSVINGHVRNYTPAKHPVNEFKATVRHAWPLDAKPFDGPVQLVATFIFPRPKSKTRKVNVREWKSSKPDIDNIYKSLADALTGLAWTDDSQVCACELRKVIADDDDLSQVVVEIRSL